VGVTPAQAGLAVAVWTGVGLLGDFLLIPLLERVRGLSYLRVSAVIELVLFTLSCFAPGVTVKFVLLGLLGLFNSAGTRFSKVSYTPACRAKAAP